MLKVILSALFVTGFFACVQSMDDKEKETALLPFTSMDNLDSYQDVRISCVSGLIFELANQYTDRISGQQTPVDAKFHTNDDSFILKWFEINKSELCLYFQSEDPTANKAILISSPITITLPKSEENERFPPAPNDAVHVEIMTKGELYRLQLHALLSGFKEIKTQLSTLWISFYFAIGKRTQGFLKDHIGSTGIEYYKGPIVKIDAEEFRDIEILSGRMRKNTLAEIKRDAAETSSKIPKTSHK